MANQLPTSIDSEIVKSIKSKGSKLQWGKTDVEIDECSYCWVITNIDIFNLCWEGKKWSVLSSPKFSMEKNSSLEWELQLYPMGQNEEHRNFMSIFLFPGRKFDQSIEAHYSISILDEKNEEKCTIKSTRIFPENSMSGHGTMTFCKKSQLINSNLTPGNVLRIFCKLKTIYSINKTQGKVNAERNVFQPTAINLERQFKSGEFSDFTIIAENKKFRVHKFFMAAASPVFNRMLSTNMKENFENSLTISDIPANLIQEMLRFIYLTKVDNLEIIATELLAVANKYQIEELEELCEQTLIKNLDNENAWDWLILSDLYGRRNLKNRAMRYVISNKRKLTETKGYKRCAEKKPRLLAEVFEFEAVYKRQALNQN